MLFFKLLNINWNIIECSQDFIDFYRGDKMKCVQVLKSDKQTYNYEEHNDLFSELVLQPKGI